MDSICVFGSAFMADFIEVSCPHCRCSLAVPPLRCPHCQQMISGTAQEPATCVLAQASVSATSESQDITVVRPHADGATLTFDGRNAITTDGQPTSALPERIGRFVIRRV